MPNRRVVAARGSERKMSVRGLVTVVIGVVAFVVIDSLITNINKVMVSHLSNQVVNCGLNGETYCCLHNE